MSPGLVRLAFRPAWPTLRDRVGRGGAPRIDAMQEAQGAEQRRDERLAEVLAEKLAAIREDEA